MDIEKFELNDKENWCLMHLLDSLINGPNGKCEPFPNAKESVKYEIGMQGLEKILNIMRDNNFMDEHNSISYGLQGYGEGFLQVTKTKIGEQFFNKNIEKYN